MLDCPSDLTLARLGHDTLDVVQRTAIEEHVQHCEKCVGVLEKIVSHGTATASESASLPAEESLPNIPGFAIEGEIGRGGMGVVYRAWEPKLARTVALKIVRSGPMTGSRERKRWLSEARCGTRVCHPNVVQLHDADEADGWLYLVLEFVSGGSLKDRLDGPLPARAAAELMIPVAAAMTAVHAAGLLHLDLKPSNILLDSALDASWKDASPKVADFGIARPLADPGTSSASVAGPWGTPSYMAPEQVAGDRAVLGPATDVYALGAILYELLTGRPSFQGVSTLETLDQVRRQQPVPPRRLNPTIPRDLETIALKCLEKIPSRRYASAEEMADDLRRWLDGKPIAARPVSTFEQSWSWCRRYPAITTLAGTLLITFSVSFLTIVVLWRHAEDARNRAEREQTRSDREWRRAELERGRADRERMSAEADYQAARAALAQVLNVGMVGLWKRLSRNDLIGPLQVARARMIDLANVRPNDPEIWRLCSHASLVLGRDLGDHGDWVKSQPLLIESLSYSEKFLHRYPRDVSARWQWWEISTYLARAVEYQGNAEEGVRLLERVVAWVESQLPLGSDFTFDRLVQSRVSLARVLARTGNPDSAMTILEANLRMIRELPAEKMTPNVAARLHWTHRELGALMERYSPAEFDRLTAEDWAQRFAALLCSSPQTDSASVNEELWTAYRLIAVHEQTAASHRKNDKLDEACLIADGMHAFGLLVVARYPDQPAAHLLLEHAYTQRAKNYWRLNDREGVKRSWMLALEEARRTASLDPENERAHGDVADIQRRLDDLHNPRPEPVVSSAPEREVKDSRYEPVSIGP